MRLGLVHWLIAGTCALVLHGSLLLAWPIVPDGIPGPPPGPAIAIAESVAGVLGEAVEIEAAREAPQLASTTAPAALTPESSIAPQPPSAVSSIEAPPPAVPQASPAMSPQATAPSLATADVIAAAPPIDVVATPDPGAGLPVVPTREGQAGAKQSATAPSQHAVLLPPRQPVLLRQRRAKQEKRQPDRTRPKRQRENKSRTSKAPPAKVRGKGRRRADRRGTRRAGRGGAQARRRGGGRGRASPGAIASFKSRVRARIAGCVRHRVSGRGPGRVVIRFGVSTGGRARGVSASGSGSLRAIAASAARGCTFPRPPRGAAGLRFAFPVSVR